MAVIVHLSDLHLLADVAAQKPLLDSLVAALGTERHRLGPADLLVITGDVFNSSTLDTSAATSEFRALFDRIEHALGGAIPTVILPGNHDRRDLGVIGPNDERLFRALSHAMSDRPNVHVNGCTTPFLAEQLAPGFHKLPIHLVAYDSSYLTRGLMSAGGVVRQEDLLDIADGVSRAGARDEHPLVLLLHHHLIPTPLTDLVPIESHHGPAIVRWAVDRILPALIAHGDREELMMTALGAGTALTTLHAFGRAVIVLHGHKHYPNARVLQGTREGDGDLVLASAGSGGTTQSWNPTGHPEAPRLWPNFNLLDLSDEHFTVDTVYFSYSDRAKPVRRRRLVDLAREGRRWRVRPVRPDAATTAPDLARNEAVFALAPSPNAPHDLWDVHCTRTLEPADRDAPSYEKHPEFVAGIANSRVTDIVRDGVKQPDTVVPARIDLAIDGVTSYRHQTGLCRSVREAAIRFADGSAFEWVALLNRYGSRLARLVLHHPGPPFKPFGSVTDLGSGEERPALVTGGTDHAVLEVRDCPPRTLLRIYWKLDAG